MAQLEQIPAGSKVLNDSADAILVSEIKSVRTQDWVDEMLRIANNKQGDKKRRTMVGLAAPQVGLSKRIIVVDVASDGKSVGQPELRAYINPVIIKRSEQTEQGREGCWSTGNVCGIVERSREVTIEAYNKNGEKVMETWNGFTARILQHEIDHLDGVRFPDRIEDDSKLHWVEPELFGDYRKHWETWKVKCPRKKWLAIKSGDIT